jgi:hypothetical protein
VKDEKTPPLWVSSRYIRVTPSAVALSNRRGLPLQKLALEPAAPGAVRLRGWLPLPLPRAGRLLCSAELAGLVPPRRARPLAVPYGRPLQLGRLTLALFPAGSGVGAAVALLAAGGRTYVVALTARPDALPLGAALDLPDGDVLVLDGRLAVEDHTPVADLVAHVHAVAAAPGPLVWCVEPAAVALEAAALFADPGRLRVAPGLLPLFRRARFAGLAVPSVRCLGARVPNDGVILCTQAGLPAIAARLPGVGVAWLGPGVTADAGALHGRFARGSGASALLRLALHHPAADVVLVGTEALALADALERAGKSVTVLDPAPQMALL